MVAAVEQVVRAQDDTAGPQRPDLERRHERPAGLANGIAHSLVVRRSLQANVLPVVGRMLAAHGDPIHALHDVVEVEVVGAGEVVVILFVIEGPVLRIGNDRRGPHVLAHGLRVVQQLDLDRVVMARLAHVVRAVVVLVPPLIEGVAEVGRVVGEGHDRPVPSDQALTGFDDARRVDDVEHFRNQGRGDAFPLGTRTSLQFKDAFVQSGTYAETFRRERDESAADKVGHQGLGIRVTQCKDPLRKRGNLVSGRIERVPLFARYWRKGGIAWRSNSES